MSMSMSMPTPLKPILIAGPTASGKSALALALAERLGGVVINADSMQVYADLRILTARPTASDEARAPHALYGFVDAREAYSAGRFVADCAAAIASANAKGLRPIIVGGSGLYFKALSEGLSPIPTVPDAVRQKWRALAKEHGAHAMWTVLMDLDPEMALRLAPNDSQRIVRALEVQEATGQSLAAFQRVPGAPVIDSEACYKFAVLPDRRPLYARAEARFDQMIGAGALDEVHALAAQGLAADLPAMRALGVAALMAHLRGESSLADAVTAAKAETRQYIKRQETWIRRYMITWNMIVTQETEINTTEVMSFIQS